MDVLSSRPPYGYAHPMRDDWRLRVELDEEAGARELTDRLEAFRLAHDLKTAFADRVIVSRDGAVVFCYTDSREQALAASRAIEQLAAEHDWRLETSLQRWHPESEQWVPATEPLPQTPQQHEEEHAELIAEEREESETQGYPLFEVRIRCASGNDARQLAEKLAAEGLPTAHRWQFVVVGASDEDTARNLGDRLRSEIPAGCEVEVGGSVQEIAQDVPLGTPFSPFAVFGGLGN